MPIASLLKPFLAPLNPTTDFREALALGLLGPKVRVFHVFSAAATTTEIVDLWPNGGNLIYPSQGTAASVVSDDAADAAAGTGARVVEVVGWDDQWKLATETVSLAGLTPVATTGTFWRVIRARVVSAGPSESNVGTIAVALDGNHQTGIFPTVGGSASPHFTIPTGHVGYVYDWSVSPTKGGAETDYGGFYFVVRPPGKVFYPLEGTIATDGAALARSGPLALLEAGTDLSVRAWSSGPGANRFMATSYRVAVMPAE